ncbi:MAG: amino acid-binding ACT [Nitrospinae bacterium]|nr:amino acid-binding ACT [Nitrospinota bacterium]
MKNWFMLSLVGRDQPSIVAKLSAGLCKNGCNLGESSMSRLGNYFTIMLMVEHEGDKSSLQTITSSVCNPLKLDSHLVLLEDGSQQHFEPDVRISLFAEDRMGVVEDATVPLANAGLNILHLESDLGENTEAGTYYIHLEGTLAQGITPIYNVLEKLEKEKGIKSHLIPINAQIS